MATEFGIFSRFERAPQAMGYTGPTADDKIDLEVETLAWPQAHSGRFDFCNEIGMKKALSAVG